MRIVTHFVHPPIPIRSFDWSAVDDETYGGDPSDKIGHGATREAAINDLLDQIGDESNLSGAEQKAQAARCPCHGSDDYCPCQNAPDGATRQTRRAARRDRR